MDLRRRLNSQQTIWAAGAYDVLSARIIEEAGFDAIFTSGFGISASLLGQPDSGLYTLAQNVAVVRNVAKVLSKPIIADMDAGYGDSGQAAMALKEFEAAGVSAIVIEDKCSIPEGQVSNKRENLVPIDEASGKIASLVAASRTSQTVIIARTNATTVEEAAERARQYVAAGADLIQPASYGVTTMDGLRSLRNAAGVPLSVQIVGWLQDLQPDEIESVAGLATFPLVSTMTVAAVLRSNMKQLAKVKNTRILDFPTMEQQEFQNWIGTGLSEVGQLSR